MNDDRHRTPGTNSAKNCEGGGVSPTSPRERVRRLKPSRCHLPLRKRSPDPAVAGFSLLRVTHFLLVAGPALDVQSRQLADLVQDDSVWL